MTQLEQLQELIRQFNIERDWDQFHNNKDLSIALSIEASELLQAFLWKDSNEAPKEKIDEELADVFIYALMIAYKNNIDIERIVKDKIKRNADKYPIDKAKGNAKKYNEL